MKYISFKILLLTVLIVGFGCNDTPKVLDPNDPNNPANPNSPLNPNNPNNPCFPATANFTMTEYGRTFGQKFAVSDTTINNTPIAFEALQDCQSYEWKVGADNRTWTTKKFRLMIGNITEFPQRIPVRLIVHKKIDSTCKHPLGNKQVDTVMKYLTVVSTEKSPLLGQFFGANTDDPSDTFRVTVKYLYTKRLGNGWDQWHKENGHYRSFVFFNLHKGCQTIIPEGDTIYVGGSDYPVIRGGSGTNLEVTYRGMRFTLFEETNMSGCYGTPMFGLGIISTTHDSLIVNYTVPKFYSKESRTRDERVSKTFIGRRVR